MTVTEFELASVGETMVLLAPSAGQRLRTAATVDVHTAGAESNVAVQLARLGHRVTWVSRVGADVFGDRVLAEIAAAGVDTSHVHRDSAHPTGVYFKDSDGQQTRILYYRRGSAASTIEPSDVTPVLGRTRVIHVTGITPALSRSCEQTVEHVFAHRGDAEISFDVNHRPAIWTTGAAEVLLALARQADIVFVGRDEAERLWHTPDAAAIRGLLPHVPRVIVKDGDIGATSFGPAGTVFSPAPAVEVVEPVGAGDAFAAGYLSARLRDLPEMARLRWGHLLAAAALLSTADHAPLPDLADLNALVDLDTASWRELRLTAALPDRVD